MDNEAILFTKADTAELTAECGEVYSRLAKGGSFPTVQFDWDRL